MNKEFLNSYFSTTGKLIVFEGYDGVGKTSLAQALTQRLNHIGYNFQFTFEPTPHFNQFKQQVLEAAAEDNTINIDSNIINMDSNIVNICSFSFDRIEHIQNTIFPLLSKGVSLICDRYDWSMLAYQDFSTNESKDLLFSIRNTMADYPPVYLYVYFNASIELIQKRLLLRDGHSPDLSHIKRVLYNYETILEFFLKHHFSQVVVFNVFEEDSLDNQLNRLITILSNKVVF